MNALDQLKRKIDARQADDRATSRLLYQIESLPTRLVNARTRLRMFETRAVTMNGPLARLPDQIDRARRRLDQLEGEARRLGMGYLIEKNPR